MTLLQPIDKYRAKQYLIYAIVISLLHVGVEYVVRLKSGDPQAFLPLIIRSVIAAILIALSIVVHEMVSKEKFVQKPFLYLVLVRTTVYTLVISFWLTIINGIWQIITNQYSFKEGILDYLQDEAYPINLITIFVIMLLGLTALQINGLHRKGELVNFILGRYHQPKEVSRAFAFIDLKNSTSMAEKLGHYQFGLFLKDYYSDLTNAIWSTKAEIYQYVGDEIILSWPKETGFTKNNIVQCVLQMEKDIRSKEVLYLEKFGFLPQFRTGAHYGKVLVTWVGEIKKEIVYVGDVLNTTARIQEDCKRLNHDFLMSEEIAKRLSPSSQFTLQFQEEIILRGKERGVKLYALEK